MPSGRDRSPFERLQGGDHQWWNEHEFREWVCESFANEDANRRVGANLLAPTADGLIDVTPEERQ